jgi:hypothetical protein
VEPKKLVLPASSGLSAPLKRPREVEAEHAIVKTEAGVEPKDPLDDPRFVLEKRGSGKWRRVIKPGLEKEDPEAYKSLMDQINPGYLGHVRCFVLFTSFRVSSHLTLALAGASRGFDPSCRQRGSR